MYKGKLIILIFLVFFISACREDMQEQPRLNPLSGSSFFSDSMGSRPRVEGTVAEDDSDDVPDSSYNPPITSELMDRGENRYKIYCSPCHGISGYADGLVVRRGFSKPPNFNTDSLRATADKDFINAMKHGYGSMPDYAAELSPNDRRAIIVYIRALQLSQHAHLSDIPEPMRKNIR